YDGGPEGGTVYRDQQGNFHTGRWVGGDKGGNMSVKEEVKEEEVLREEKTAPVDDKLKTEFQAELSNKEKEIETLMQKLVEMGASRTWTQSIKHM
ncbi:unnamed protein product, partial [Ectocarpus sp. 8 AP-2014]